MEGALATGHAKPQALEAPHAPPTGNLSSSLSCGELTSWLSFTCMSLTKLGMRVHRLQCAPMDDPPTEPLSSGLRPLLVTLIHSPHSALLSPVLGLTRPISKASNESFTCGHSWLQRLRGGYRQAAVHNGLADSQGKHLLASLSTYQNLELMFFPCCDNNDSVVPCGVD
jgi:hypothetical protein